MKFRDIKPGDMLYKYSSDMFSTFIYGVKVSVIKLERDGLFILAEPLLCEDISPIRIHTFIPNKDLDKEVVSKYCGTCLYNIECDIYGTSEAIVRNEVQVVQQRIMCGIKNLLRSDEDITLVTSDNVKD